MVEKTVPKSAHPKGIGGVTGGLALRLESLTVEDRLEVKFNDHPLPWDQAQISFDGWAREQVAPLFWTTYPTYPVEQKMERTSVEFADCCSPEPQDKRRRGIALGAAQDAKRASKTAHRVAMLAHERRESP